MTNTLIDFRGDHGTPYAVYESELDRDGKVQILRPIFKPHAAQTQFFSARERHVIFHGNRGSGKSAAVLWKAIQNGIPCARLPSGDLQENLARAKAQRVGRNAEAAH